jgi:hypothetical protein
MSPELQVTRNKRAPDALIAVFCQTCTRGLHKVRDMGTMQCGSLVLGHGGLMSLQDTRSGRHLAYGAPASAVARNKIATGEQLQQRRQAPNAWAVARGLGMHLFSVRRLPGSEGR